MDIICRKCGNSNFYMQQKGAAIGLYCDTCGAWQKWVGKKEVQILKNRGIKLFPQNANISLKNNHTFGLEMVDVKSMGIEMESKEENEKSFFEKDNEESFGSKPKDLDIEAEIERRVSERLKNMDKKVEDSKKSSCDNVEGGYCPVCEGNPLVAEGNSRVEVTIFSGVLTVTDIEGLNIYGLYKLKRCPYCGKMF